MKTKDEDDKLRKAVAQLDDANDLHWLADGRPTMQAVQLFFGDGSPSREEVDAIGRLRKTPAPRQAVTPGRIVSLRFGKPFDGSDTAAGLVVKVEDDDSINVKAFAPNGGSDHTFTGVLYREVVDAMPDGADKNAARSCTWEWPARA